MTPFPRTKAWKALARRVVWFKSPEESLAEPVELLAYAMKHSLDEDMNMLHHHVGTEGLRFALDHAPPGVIDVRSWSYWNHKVGRYPAPPLPVRRLPG